MGSEPKVKKPWDYQGMFEKLEGLSDKYPNFKWEAFGFVLTGMNFTISQLKERRHVNGKELAEGIRDFALKEFGPMAHTVLEFWGIRSTYDIGRIVFALIEAELLFKNDNDRLEDFKEVYSMDDSLANGYWQKLREKFKFEPILRPLRSLEQWTLDS